MELVCECKNEIFYFSPSAKLSKCSKCGIVYNDKGEKVKEIMLNERCKTYNMSINSEK